MNDNIFYWIWLQQVIGYGSCKIKRILSEYNDAKSFYELGYAGWKSSHCLTVKGLERAKKYSYNSAKKIIEECVKLNQSIITFNDVRYPERLKNIDNSPCVLYIRGDLPDIDNSIAISIVGTRAADESSMMISYNFATELTKSGALIVSGGALGIDEAAHKGAIDSGGKTVCVLGSGLDVNYPKENSSLRYDISKNGALISEYPPGVAPMPQNFPVRNRIISGLSLGTLIVQAGKRSGALITANLALNQNRDVFAIPGDIRNELSEGTNDLIKNGAKPVTCSLDIIEEYIKVYADKFNIKDVKYEDDKKYESNNYNSNLVCNTDNTIDTSFINKLSNNAKKVYNALGTDKKHIDDISVQTKLPANIVLQAITELEIFGVINSYSGKRYSKN